MELHTEVGNLPEIEVDEDQIKRVFMNLAANGILFTPLFTTKARGMGLTICKKFVDAHGGNIEVKSEVGKGSTFTVKLPIQQDNGGGNQ